MNARIVVVALTACLVAAPNLVVAQTTTGSDVTFKVPLNLTQVSSDIAKVAVWCVISSTAITTRDGKLSKQEDLPVSGGQLVTTATVVVAVSGLDNPVGKVAGYECRLSGFSTSLQRWDVFSETQTVPAFRLSPTPAVLQGSFVW